MSADPRTVAVVTGTRAEYGLLRPVMRAIDRHEALRLHVVVTGAHLLPPDHTVEEVRAEFVVAAEVPMQSPGATERWADAAALGRGITGLAAHLADAAPDIVLVLGDRIEAFAAAAAAAVGGAAVAHLHGGDRAPGVADEAMRHAISKLAHVHLTATEQSAQRLVAMGEPPERVHVVGSPALDDLEDIASMDDRAFDELGRPVVVVLLHPVGRADDEERRVAERVLAAAADVGPVLVLHPNHDPGRGGIVAAIEASGLPARTHLPRGAFLALLRRVRLLIGNSSAALIECAAIGVRAVDIGPRQSGRQRGANVITAAGDARTEIGDAVRAALALRLPSPQPHPFGDGRAGERTAELLASVDLGAAALRKRCTY